MEFHLLSHRLEARAPDWIAAAVSGFVAGAALMVVELLWSAIMHSDDPWLVMHKVAAITMGRDALQSSDFSIGVATAALVTHYVLGIVFGVVLAVVIASFHFDSSLGAVLLTGAVFGIVIYLFDFYGMARAFPWFIDMRGWATFVAHLAFGAMAGGMYWELGSKQR